MVEWLVREWGVGVWEEEREVKQCEKREKILLTEIARRGRAGGEGEGAAGYVRLWSFEDHQPAHYGPCSPIR